MGNLFKQSTTVTKSPFETNPWAPQQPALQAGFDAGQGALSSGMDTLNGIDDFTANMTPEQKANYQATMAAGQGVQGGANGMMNTGFQMAGQNGQQFGQNAQTMMGQAGNIDQSGLNTFNGNAQDMYHAAGVNPTGGIISDAAQYADNPYLQSQIDGAMTDISHGLATQVGGINAAASGSGNINSTRAGVMEAQATDNAAQTAADVSSGMRGAAYSQGLNMSQANQQNMVANQTNANSQIAAGYGMNLATQGQGFGQGLAANGQVGQAAEIGQGMAGAGYGLSAAGLAQTQGAADAYQVQGQNEINGQVEGANAPMSLIQQYMASMGGSYGSSGYTTNVSTGQSPFQTLVGAGTAVMGMK